jgi:hypothetical protein
MKTKLPNATTIIRKILIKRDLWIDGSKIYKDTSRSGIKETIRWNCDWLNANYSKRKVESVVKEIKQELKENGFNHITMAFGNIGNILIYQERKIKLIVKYLD